MPSKARLYPLLSRQTTVPGEAAPYIGLYNAIDRTAFNRLIRKPGLFWERKPILPGGILRAHQDSHPTRENAYATNANTAPSGITHPFQNMEMWTWS